MCGIAGIITEKAPTYGDVLARMLNSLGHRGPDGSGTHYFANCALGHRRLSIVDLDTGHQPMVYPAGNIGITFNGEIYGYKEIRNTIKNDYPFRTSSDTEVILALHHIYGIGMLQYLRGMFAFSIWDDDRQELLCARDRFGEKPFYYAFGKNGEFIFASEIKAILASGLIVPILDIDSVEHYVRCLHVKPHKTIYKNIYTLPPAHMLSFRKGILNIQRYWNMPSISNSIGIEEATAQFRKLFEIAVSRQLVADVPVGAFLSGGLDSSTVVAVASKYQEKLKTFSFGFEESINELPYAKELSQLYQTDHVELTAEKEDLAELLNKMQEIYDEPFADSSNIPTYLISKMARRYVKVVLTGDGADELLGGYYWWYLPLHYMERARTDDFLKKIIISFTARFGAMSHYNKAVQLKMKTAGRNLNKSFKSIIDAHSSQNQYFTDHEIAELLNLDNCNSDNDQKYSWTSDGTLNDAFRMDIENYMPGDILVKTDRASMANGLELRTPFLDVDFASFCISLPSWLKVRDDKDKIILRHAYQTYWPELIRKRSKQGFGVPVNKWLLYDSVKEMKDTYLNDPRKKLFSLMSYEAVRRFATQNNYKTWILLILALWFENNSFDLPEVINK